MHGFEDPDTGQEHIALTLGNVHQSEHVLCRVHSECLTGDCLFSKRCDCGAQLEMALQLIAEREPEYCCIFGKKVAVLA